MVTTFLVAAAQVESPFVAVELLRHVRAGIPSSLGASGVAERNLNRITIILALVWITCIVVLGLITKFDVGI